MMLGIGLCPGFPRAIPVAKYSKDHAMTAFSISRISSFFGGVEMVFTMVYVMFNCCLHCFRFTSRDRDKKVPPRCGFDCHLHWILGHVALPFPWLVAENR